MKTTHLSWMLIVLLSGSAGAAAPQSEMSKMLAVVEKARACNKLAENEAILRSAVKAAEKEDPSDPAWSAVVERLAERNIYLIELRKWALKLREEKLGKDHSDVADSLDALALEYEAELRRIDNKPWASRFVPTSGRRYSDGRRVPILIQSMMNDRAEMAKFEEAGKAARTEREKYASAEQLYKRAHAIRESKFGAESAEAAQSLANMSRMQDLLGRKGKAKELIERSEAILRKLLANAEASRRPEHLETAKPLEDLARWLQQQARYGEADTLLARLATIYQKEYGLVHVITLSSLEAQADNFGAQSKFQEAEPLHRRTISIRATLYGKDHIAVARGLMNFSNMLYEAKRLEESRGAGSQSQGIRTKYEAKVCSGELPPINAGNP